MTSQQIKCFLAVASSNSFTIAAEKLFLSQSVISYHVKALEKELEFKLFERDTHGVWLTPSGESFYQSVLILADEYTAAVERARQQQNRNTDHIRICIAHPTLSSMTGKIFQLIHSRVPDAELSLISRNSYDILQPLLSGDADLLLTYPGFYRNRLDLEKMELAPMWTTCLMSPMHPLAKRSKLTLADLEDQIIIFPDMKNDRSVNIRIEFSEIYRWIQSNHHLKINVSPRTFDQAQGIVATGRGVLFVHTLESEYQPNTDGLVGIPLVDVPPLPLLLVWQKPPLGKLSTSFIQQLRR